MPLSAPTSTITCPNCGRTLPGQATMCQFCGTSVANVPRPKAVVQSKYRTDTPSYVMTLYYFVASYWVVSGAWGVLSGAMDLAKGSFFAPVGMVFGLVT